MKKKKRPDPTDELVQLVTTRLQQPEDDCGKVAAAWAVELRKMDPQQQMFAKKAINDILFEGQMGTLHRHSVEINASRASTPYSVQSLPSIPFITPSINNPNSQEQCPLNASSYYSTFQE